jgi:methylglutaconyl-CoA hydratase
VYKTILLETKHQVSTLTLNRPDVHNAFNEELIADIHQAMIHLAKDPQTRVIIITGSGQSFCAGGDLNWMKRSASYSKEKNIEEAQGLHEMLCSIALCPKPVIAQINGVAMGGGVGLAAAVDIAFAHKTAQFAFSEVRLGLIPAVISPFVIRKIGPARFKELSLTAERFSATQAKEFGLIQHCGAPEEIEDWIDAKVNALKAAGPEALAETKKLIEEVENLDLKKAGKITAQKLAERRASTEGQEGIAAFFEKRKAKWVD